LNNSIFPKIEERFKKVKEYKLFKEVDNLALINFDRDEYQEFWEKLKLIILKLQ
jgi:hypothetical protein